MSIDMEGRLTPKAALLWKNIKDRIKTWDEELKVEDSNSHAQVLDLLVKGELRKMGYTENIIECESKVCNRLATHIVFTGTNHHHCASHALRLTRMKR